MRKLSKTLLSLLLIAAMLASFVVLPAAAEEPAAVQEPAVETQAETTANDSFMKIFHLDCGRKYFTKDWIIALINEISAAGYTHLQLALGNDGMRFLLDDMSLTVNGTTYSSENVAAAIHKGNEKYHDFAVDELTEKEMNAIIAHAKEKNIEILPLINTPGHMDAILSAASSLTDTNCAYNGSSRTIDVTNDTAVAFTQALLQKYVAYFAGKGCKYFNMGADEYANDKYTDGSMGFGQLVSDGNYGYFIKYVNELATMVKSADMKPVAFNDGIEFYGVTSANVGSRLYKFDKDIIVSYWSAGWSGYEPQSAANLVSNGFKVINTTGDFYYVLGKGDNFDAGYSYASNWSNTRVCGTSLNAESVVGATFCVWCDYPGAETEQEIAQKIRLPLRAMAQRMKGESVVLDENKLVSGGFKADGTINTDVDVAEDAATGIKVSAPGVKAVDVTAKTDNLPEVTGAAEVLAWEITPRDADGNAYTGEGTVTLHIPEAWTGAKVYGAVVNEDGSITEGTNLTLDEKNHTITFTVPHFSTILAVKEYAAETINLTVGQTETVFIKGADVREKITKSEDFDQYAMLTAEYGSKTETTIDVSTKATSLSNGDEIVLTDESGNYAELNSNNILENTTNKEEATVWTVERSYNSNSRRYTYYLKSADGKYLNFSSSAGQYTYTVSTTRGSGWSWSATYGFYSSSRYLGYDDSNWSVSYNNYGKGLAYSYIKSGKEVTGTTLTFKGIKAGTTYVTVDNIQYKVVVSKVDLNKQESLKLEYWITNAPISTVTGAESEQRTKVIDGGTYAAYFTRIAAARDGIATEEGLSVESLVPKTTAHENRTVYYWRARLLEVGKTNNSTSKTERQTNDSGDDETFGGVSFTRIRFYGSSWQVLTEANEWKDVSLSDYQFVAYYLEYIKVTDEVESFAADWGNKGDNTLGGWLDSNYYCSLSVQVVYEDGTTNPTGTTADDLKAKTILYGYWKDNGGRGIGTVMFEGTEYEIYKVTAETGEVTATIKPDASSDGYTGNVTNLKWDDNEKTVWEGEPSSTASVHNSANNFSKEGALENLTWDENKEAILLRVYVKAKPKADSLKVRYIDKTTGKQIHDYDINVRKGTYFDSGFAKDPDTSKKNALVNNAVENYFGITQKVSAELKDMPQIKAAYRYSDYELVEVVRKSDSEVILYYTFNDKHTFVVDFGVPLKIKATDIGVTVPEGESYWTEAICTGAVYGETKIANGEGLTYTATKPMLGIETLNVTLATGTGEDDKATHTIYLVPATTVYYEQNVAEYSAGNWTEQGSTIATDKYQEAQKGRMPGWNFGFDPYYETNQLGAGGSVMCTNTKGADATLTFKGTGMELYLRTQNANATSDPATEANNATDHSYMLVQVYAGDTADTNKLKRMSFVDVNNLFVAHGSDKYGYNTPCWTVDGMTYGTYTVVVRYVKGTSYGLAIDGFRVTNTLNPDNAETQNFYADVGEAGMQTSEIRNMVLAQVDVPDSIYNMAANMYRVGDQKVLDAVFDDADAGKISGAVIIKKDETGLNTGASTVTVDKELVNIGPKNEIYLKNGEAVVMELPGTYASVQIGMRSLSGNPVQYAVNGTEKTMTSTVDMYYTEELHEGKYLVIQNKSDDILALTKLKVTTKSKATGDGTQGGEVSPYTTPEAIRYAMALMRGIDVPQFTDVAEDAWYHDYVYDLVYRGVVNGMTATTYEPEGKLTRAQFVKLLACSLADAETLKTYEGKHPFKDSEGHWAEAYIAWAKDKGIVEGVSATEFDPEAPITREQMATIFGRYALKQGIELPKSENAAGSFPDADKISEYAREFVELMRIAGILNGYEDGTFRPQGNATRAEAAKLFSLFLSITDKLAK